MWLAKTTTPGASKSRSGSLRSAPGAVRPTPAAPDQGDDVVLLLLADIAPAHRLWGWWRVVRGAHALRGVTGLRFAKVLGSGHEGGFGLRPSASHQGVFLLFDGERAARGFVDAGPQMQAYRERARELCAVLLQPVSARGRWSGQALRPSAAPLQPGEPVAALTRASIRPTRALAFWRHAPRAQASLARAHGCRLAAGLGEAPLLRQATFSIWDDVGAMEAYARTAEHGQAIRAAYGGGHFSESMFARFRVLDMRGRWQGVDHG